MEQVHGVDVSWMTHGCPKEKGTKTTSTSRPPTSTATTQDASSAANGNSSNVSAASDSNTTKPPPSNANANANASKDEKTEASKAVPAARPGLKRGDSSEKSGPNGTPPSARRNSWFSSFSSKFSASPSNGANGAAAAPQHPSSPTTPPKEAKQQPPRVSPARHAVLPHATKSEGEHPYTPAPPTRNPSSFLGVFRRLSSSSGAALGPGQKSTHGLVERKVLNVDHHRERCKIDQLHQAKLRRVAFCVDVEIAPQPKYVEADTGCTPAADKTQKRKMAEKSEGEALKNPVAVEVEKEEEGVVKATGEPLPKEPEKEGMDAKKDVKEESPKGGVADKEREAKKKEKKKKSEEERKARKEKKRKLAEANGTIPMEIHVDDSDSSTGVSAAGTGSSGASKTTSYPTTNPVRIYRRCCQLRETPILKKITEQLTDPANCSEGGIVDKIDLTNYWLQLPDLITLGDYFAVVPVREVLLENCGLSDEGLRVILAGLLAARRPETRRKKPTAQPDGLTAQGGVVERLVLKNNKLGAEGWKHVCLFIYLCHTLKYLDLSMIALPRPPASPAAHNGHRPLHLAQKHNGQDQVTLASLLSKAVSQRLAGSTLELLHIGGMNPTSEELGVIIDGVVECGVKRLGLAHNNLDLKGFEHVARFIAGGRCVGLDLGGNDLRDHLDVLAEAISKDTPLWGLSLAECNLRPGSLCKMFPKLVHLKDFRFIDLSHNQDLCKSEPSVVSMLRKYLPKLEHLKRVHLADIAMTSEQAIALAEILPEIQGLAHISFLENPDLVKLADARTEEQQEEACALYASLLAATRVSPTIVCVDIDVPGEKSGEIVKAMAKQVVAYCLRNLQRFPIAEISSAVQALSDSQDATNGSEPPNPDALAHLIGHDVLDLDEAPSDHESTPDEDYVIGGTGVVKALTCCLKNRGEESGRPSGEFVRDAEGGSGTPTPATPTTRPKLPPGKAKDMSKHLLAGARKIRIRLQPAIAKAKANLHEEEEEQNLRKLMFLDTTLENIIKRFEDEYPDTRVAGASEEAKPGTAGQALANSTQEQQQRQLGTSPSSAEHEADMGAIASDPEDDFDLAVRPSLTRTNSAISHTSRALAEEEGRMLRAGHKFRSGIIKPEYYDLLNGLDEAMIEPKHITSLKGMIEELDNTDLSRKVEEKGVVRLMREDREQLREALRKLDPEYWERFVESQEKARGNVQVPMVASGPGGGGDNSSQVARNESAVED